MAQAASLPGIVCPDPQLGAGMQGIARIAVDDANAVLLVTFQRPIMLPQDAFLLDVRNYVLTGGASIFPRVTSAQLSGVGSPPFTDEPSILLGLTALGDFSVYTLTVSGPSIDPFFASRTLRFRLSCDERFDCRAPASPALVEPEIDVAIDYLAKDYASFRQALLDFIPTRLPQWTERNEADLGVVLLELFAATADTLSYMQDRVASEAFLSTATQRRSVARHLALIGYQIDEGAAACTWLQLQVNAVEPILADASIKVSNRPDIAGEPILVFETLGAATVRPEHNRMEFYTWGNRNCCLPATATSAALAGSHPYLAIGDWLLIEDDSGHRDIVRLTSTPSIVPEPGGGVPSSPPDETMITLLAWSGTTPLSIDYCLCDVTISPPTPRSWVRGNVVPATHGETVTEDLRRLTDAQRAALQVEITARPTGMPPPRQRLALTYAPLAHLDPDTLALVAPGGVASTATVDPLTAILSRRPRSISTLRIVVEDEASATKDWQEVATLLESGPDDPVFRVEIDDDGEATVVFGDGIFGRRLDEAATVVATYRIGGGEIGNVAADTLARAIPDPLWLDAVTNPVAASGGRDFETRQHALSTGPATSHDPLVLVTAADYQAAAQDFVDAAGDTPVRRANATFSWSGSWLSATLAVDPVGGQAQALDTYLEGRRLAGYDVEIVPAIYVPLDIVVQFCTARGFRPSDVAAMLQQALSSADLPSGAQGFFHPERFAFGDRLYVSQLYAAIMATPGVDSAQITRLARLHAAQPNAETSTNLAQGFLDIGAGQILRADNDRNFPQNGSVTIVPVGAET
jgi:hypothetical protein